MKSRDDVLPSRDSSFTFLLPVFRRLVERRSSAAEGCADQCTLLAANQPAYACAGARRASEDERAFLPGPPALG